MIHLVVTLKGRTIGRFDVDGLQVRIGRHPDNEVQIDNMSVSRFHCLLEKGNPGGGWTVEDQGSHNGTYLNGAKLSQRGPLRSGDILGVGQFHVSVRTDQAAAASNVISVRPTRAPETRELAATEKAFLVRENSAGANLSLDRDLFQVGALTNLELVMPGPRKRAMIVRGHGGFQLVNVADPAEVVLNGDPVEDRAWLSEDDKIQIGELVFSFHRGLSPDEGDQSTMEIQMPQLPPGFELK